MSRNCRGARPRMSTMSALTLVEVAIYVALMSLIGTPIVGFALVSSNVIQENETVGRLEGLNRMIHFRLSREIRMAIVGSLSVSADGKTLSFTLPLGFSEAGVISGSTIAYELELMPGESANGADDNGNGLVDEARLVRRDVKSGTVTVQGESLSFPGSRFAIVDAAAARLTLTTIGSIGIADQHLVTVSRVTTVNARN